MFIWQYLDLPLGEIEKIQQEFRDNLPNNDFFFQYMNIDSTTFLGLEIDGAALIQVPPMGFIDDRGIHTDSTERLSSLAVNIPLENCAESFTKFWKTNKPITVSYTSNNLPYHSFNVEDCEKISELKFIHPFIFDTKIPHSVSNPQHVWRRGISLRFKDDPSFLIEKYRRVG